MADGAEVPDPCGPRPFADTEAEDKADWAVDMSCGRCSESIDSVPMAMSGGRKSACFRVQQNRLGVAADSDCAAMPSRGSVEGFVRRARANQELKCSGQ